MEGQRVRIRDIDSAFAGKTGKIVGRNRTKEFVRVALDDAWVKGHVSFRLDEVELEK